MKNQSLDKILFYNLSFDELKLFLINELGIEKKKVKMRAQQLFSAVYKKG